MKVLFGQLADLASLARYWKKLPKHMQTAQRKSALLTASEFKQATHSDILPKVGVVEVMAQDGGWVTQGSEVAKLLDRVIHDEKKLIVDSG